MWTSIKKICITFWFIYSKTFSLNITKCCEDTRRFDAASGACRIQTNDSGRIGKIFDKFKPKIFSLSDGDYVEDDILINSFRLPTCSPEEEIKTIRNIGEDDQQFVLLADGGVFLTEVGETEDRFCVDTLYAQGEEVIGTVALVCGISRRKECSQSICINSCCPQETVFNATLGECTLSPGFQLRPQFFDQNRNKVTLVDENVVKLFFKEPDCPHIHTLRDDEFYLGDDGLLHVGHHTLHHSQFCLNPHTENNSTRQFAKVCSLEGDSDYFYSLLSSFIIPALIVVSEVFLLVTFALHILVPDFRSQIFGWMKMCTVGSLFLAYQWFLISSLGGTLLLDHHNGICQMIGFLIQFSFLSSFSWMTSMSVEVWRTFRTLTANAESGSTQRSQRRRFRLYNLFSFGLPTLITLVTLVIHLMQPQRRRRGDVSIIAPGMGSGSCFLDGYLAKMIYFHGSIAVLLLVNLVLFLQSAYALLAGVWAPSTEDGSARRLNGQMLWIVVELFLVMGLTWTLEVVNISLDWVHGRPNYLGPGAVVFDVLNSLQGFLIFLVLICKPRMRALIRTNLSARFSSCTKRSSADSVDFATTKEAPMSPKTLSTSVLKTETSNTTNKQNNTVSGEPETQLRSPEKAERRSLQGSVRHSSSSLMFWNRGSYDLNSSNQPCHDSNIRTISLCTLPSTSTRDLTFSHTSESNC